MKRIGIIVWCLALALAACDSKSSGETKEGQAGDGGEKTAQTAPKSNFVPAHGQEGDLQFSHTVMEFGPVNSGDTVRATYRFKNMSDHSIAIERVITSCECMQTEFPQGNLAPGFEGEIKVNFLTAGQWGTHEKILSVMQAGDPYPKTLQLKGQIARPAGQ